MDRLHLTEFLVSSYILCAYISRRRHNNTDGKFQCEIEGCGYNVNDKTQMTAHSKYHHKSQEESLVFSNDHMDILSLAPSESGL